MAKAERLPSGTWRVRVYLGKDKNGKKKYKAFTDTDRRRCERIASEYADTHRTYKESCTFKSAIDAYINSRKAVLSPSTIRGYNNIAKQLKTHYSAFCELPVHNIDQRTLQTIINDMTMFVGSKTVRNRYGLIASVIRFSGYMPPYIKLPERVKPNLRVPDTNDVKILLKASKNTNMEIPILLAAFAPMRRGEICALHMDDIKGNTIHVQRAIVEASDGSLVEKSPKTYDGNRYIVMPNFVIDRINELGFITDTNKPRMLTLRFERLVKKCGLEGLRFHSLRHFCCSWLHAQGIPEQFILERGGWSDSGVMKNVYRHALASEEDEINKTISSSFTKVFFENNI